MTDYTLTECIFPRADIFQPDELYFRTDGKVCAAEREVRLTVGQTCRTDTYFNAFDAEFWRGSTDLKTVDVSVEAEGRLHVDLIAYDKRPREGKTGRGRIVATATIEGGAAKVFRNVPLADLGLKAVLGFVADGDAALRRITFSTEEEPCRKAKLAMAVCTFKREDFVLPNIERWRRELFEDEEWRGRFRLFVIDNGNTLEQGDDGDVKIVHNVNSGGSGGFTRGMMLAEEDETCTHLLLMDDDLVLHSGVLKRAWLVCRYIRPNVCVNATMLRLDQDMCTQNERGAGVSPKSAKKVWALLKIADLNKDARDFSSVFREDDDGIPLYGGWWWWMCPLDAWRKDKVGYSFPYFLKNDDAEFNFRLIDRGYKVTFPAGLAVWHQPFFAKQSPVMCYFWMRNNLIFAAQRGVKLAEPFRFFFAMLRLLLIRHYESAEVAMRGAEDFLEGPEYCISRHEPTWALRLGSTIKDEKGVPLTDEQKTVMATLPLVLDKRPLWLRMFDLPVKLILASLVWLLFFRQGKRIRNVILDKGRIPLLRDHFFCRGVTYLRPPSGDAYTVRFDRARLKSGNKRAWALSRRMKKERAAANALWRDALAIMTTREFWTKYLNLEAK